MTIGGKNWLRTGTAVIALIAMSGPGLTQDNGGLNANLSFSQGIVSSSDDGTYGQTNLGFGLTSVTSNQNLSFRVSTGLEERFDDGFDTEVIDPTFNLSYDVESRQSVFEVAAIYRRADVDSLTLSTDPLSNVLVLDSGKREQSGLTFGYLFGRESRFGGSFNASYDALDYTQTTDPDLIDSTTVGAGLGLRFDITPRVTATLGYSYSDTDRDGAASLDVESRMASAGAQLILSQTMSAGLSLGHKTVETSNDFGLLQSDDGTTFNANLRIDRPIGAITLNLGSDISQNGRRTEFDIGRTLETRRGGEVFGRAGLTRDDDGNTNPLYELQYSESQRRSAYAISLEQNITTSDLGEDALNTRLGLDYDYALTGTTDFQSAVNYQTSNFLDTDTRTSRFDVSVGLSRDLTEDWAVSSRYTYTVRSSDTGADDTENKLFLGIETNFGWRP